MLFMEREVLKPIIPIRLLDEANKMAKMLADGNVDEFDKIMGPPK